MEFYASTTVFRRTPIEELIGRARAAGLALEFSSGIPFHAGMKEIFLRCDLKRLPHNYFPAPAEPFVLNLASLDPAIRRRSVEHCRQGLELASESGAPFFSVHAGLCLDPDPSQLGHQLDVERPFQREKNWAAFLDSLSGLIREADDLGVGLLVENNVLASFNLPSSGQNPLLCVDPAECLRLLREVDHTRLGLLLDTAHLKVSSGTLGFSAAEGVQALAPFVQALHHSDNDGLTDSNQAISASYWFLQWMPLFSQAVHVLEVHDQHEEQIKAQRELLGSAILKGA
jgi:sugar phosphate isomerase/epimerase